MLTALSPYASFAGSGLESRYRSIGMPVLSITSDEDADALGLVTSPSLRKAPYQYMPVGDKYLAVLAGIPHTAFSGGDAGGWPGQRLTPTARALAVAAVQGISTAFLDSVIKDDAIAREWLRKDANRWLKNTGELKHK